MLNLFQHNIHLTVSLSLSKTYFELLYYTFFFLIQQDYVKSSIVADGALFFTDVIPFSIALFDEYVSLVPITCPLDALRLKL